MATDFFLILAHPVYKMWIKQEPNMLELWNKLQFEEEKTQSMATELFLLILILKCE